MLTEYGKLDKIEEVVLANLRKAQSDWATTAGKHKRNPTDTSLSLAAYNRGKMKAFEAAFEQIRMISHPQRYL